MRQILEGARPSLRRPTLGFESNGPAAVLLFIVVPIAEIYVIIQVGQAIGALWTILLLIVDSIIGARLLSLAGAAGRGCASRRRSPPAGCRTARCSTES